MAGAFVVAVLSLTAAPLEAQALSTLPAHGVSVPPDLQRRLGVKTTVLTAVKRKSQVDAFAKVLDPGPLAALEADLRTALAAAKASGAEAARSRALHLNGGTISAKDMEAAEAQARADATHAAFLRQRLGLEWGPGVARMDDRHRQALIHSLVTGTAALVHVDTPSNAGQAGARTVRVDVGDGSVAGVVLGPARTAEPRLQSSGLIVEVSGPSAILLSIGLTNSAHIDTGSPQSGVTLPQGALIRYRGSTWAYVRRGGAVFERRLVQDPASQDQGVFVASGFTPGEEVATEGAAALFAAELGQSEPVRSPGQVN